MHHFPKSSNMAGIQILDTNKGKPGILYDGYRFRLAYTTKKSDLSWRCSSTKCKARLTTDGEKTIAIDLKPDHNHLAVERQTERDKIRTVLKQKALEDISGLDCCRLIRIYTLLYHSLK